MSVDVKIYQPKLKKDLECYHCGEQCRDSSIAMGEKVFCCKGCRLVYELLEENNLCDYYQFDKNPGVSPDEFGAPEKYSFLEDNSIQKQLIQESGGSGVSVNLFIPSMHCSSCIWLLENLERLNGGIIESRVDFVQKELNITYNRDKTGLREIVENLASIGYEPQFNHENLRKTQNKSEDRDLYLKIGVAGFAFANIMLLSFPEYLSGEAEIDAPFRVFFGYMNILLALPVLLYSSINYFKSARTGFRQRLINIDVPISLGIITLFSRSLYEILSGYGTGYMDSFTGLILLLLVGKLFQNKTHHALSFERDYKSYFPIAVTIRKKKERKTIPLSKLRVGDRIIVRNAELIPADSVLIKGDGYIDYSFVTGESNLVKKISGEIVYAGGRQSGSHIELEVVKDVSQSYLTKLWNQDIFHKDNKSRMITISDTISKYFTIAVLLIAAASAIYWLPENAHLALNAFTAVLIVACPCALALSAPFTLGNTLRIFSRNRFYVKNTSVIEAISKTDIIVFDKTGTLTGTGSDDVTWHYPDHLNEPLSDPEKQFIKSITAQSIHPLSQRISRFLEADALPGITRFNEIPGAGIEGIVKGVMVKIGSDRFIGVKKSSFNSMTTSIVHIELDGIYRGCFRLGNSYRKGLKDILKNLKTNYRLSMITGDNDREKSFLQELFGSESDLKFNQSPHDKLEYIKNLQSQKNQVMMIGDGLNDAGALKQSDAGIAVSENISGFSPACDGIAQAESFIKLDRFIRFSRISMNIISISFIISFLYNIIGLGFAVQGTLSPLISAVLMPVSSITVMVFTTVATNFMAARAGLRSKVGE